MNQLSSKYQRDHSPLYRSVRKRQYAGQYQTTTESQTIDGGRQREQTPSDDRGNRGATQSASSLEYTNVRDPGERTQQTGIIRQGRSTAKERQGYAGDRHVANLARQQLDREGTGYRVENRSGGIRLSCSPPCAVRADSQKLESHNIRTSTTG
jgi:hypothetical protein